MLKFLGKLFIAIGLITLGFITVLFLLLGRSPNLTIGSALFATVIIIVFAVAVGLFIVGMILYFVGRKLTSKSTPPEVNQPESEK